jgi:hypothetical protein
MANLTQIKDVFTCNTVFTLSTAMTAPTVHASILPFSHLSFLYISYHVHKYCIQNFKRAVGENTPNHPSDSYPDCCTEATKRSPMV